MTQPTVPGLFTTQPGGNVTPATFGFRSLPYTTIYVDPADQTGNASDGNPGTDPSAPIATTAHLNAVNFFGRLTANTLIQYLSDDASGTPVVVEYLDVGDFTLTIAQTRQVLHTGGTLNAGTVAINPAAKQAQIVHTSDLASFAPYVVTQNGGASTYGVRVTDTTTGAGAWIMSAATAAAPKTTRPLLNGSPGALTIGDGYTLTRGGRLRLALQGPPVFASGSIVIQDCAFDLDSGGPGGLNVDYIRCSYVGAIAVGGNLIDCFAQNDMVETFAGPIEMTSGGGLITTGGGVWTSSCELGGDLYVTGKGLRIGGDFLASPFFAVGGPGAGVQVQDCSADAIVFYESFSVALATGSSNPLLWGTGNTGVGLVVAAAQGVGVSSQVPPTVTGTGGDIAFIGPANTGLVQVARAAVNGQYTEAGGPATRATTWANFAAAIGSGGFNFQAHDVESGASLVGI